MWLAQIDGLLAVARARERGEPWWMLDVRRAQARIAALRRGAARSRDQAGGACEGAAQPLDLLARMNERRLAP